MPLYRSVKPRSLDWKWIVLVGGVISRIVTTGTIVCMGVYFDDIQHSFPSVNVAQLSIVFSTATGLLEGMGVIISFLILKLEARYLVIAGSLLATAGVFASCFTTSYYLLLSCLGLFNGIGQAMARYIMPAAVGHAFDDKTRHIGLSIINAGDGVGGVIFPFLFSWLIDIFTWRNAMMITAGLILNLFFCGCTVPVGLLTKKKRDVEKESEVISSETKEEFIVKNHDGSIAESNKNRVSLFPNIILFYLNIITHSIGYFIFMTFVYSDMKEKNVNPSTVSAVASIIGGVSIIGRLSVSFMQNKSVPRWLIYSIGHVIRGLSVLCTLLVPDNQIVLAYSLICTVFGMTDGVTGALLAVICVDLFGLDRFNFVLGWEMLIMGSGALIGVPIAGGLKDAFKSYKVPFAFAGFSFIFSGLILLPFFFTRKHYEIERRTNNKKAESSSKQNMKHYRATNDGVELVDVRALRRKPDL